MTPPADFFCWRWTPLRIVLFALLLAACAFTRLYDLGQKPIMHDESLFAFYTEFQLHRTFSYQYQPILHGPAMLWIQSLVFRIFGVSDYTLRLGVALLGIGGFLWVFSLRRLLGDIGTWVALAFYTVSPCLLFYQRFFRNDGLFMFATLWIVASAMHWWHGRKPAWGASFILANVALFSNKESCLFVYLALGTFFLLWLAHDWTRHFLREESGTPSSSILVTTAPAPPILATAALFFLLVTLFLTRVLEGIRYDSDVVAAIGRDFVLRDVRSIPLALGWMAPVESAGRLGEPWTWRLFYLGLAAVSLLGSALLHFGIRNRWGHRAFLQDFWSRVHAGRFYLIGALGLGFALYMVLFTTFFEHPKGPFRLYHETLAYWMGQNAQHRIRGPFHMHMVNMLVYQLPEVLLILGAWLYLAIRLSWTRTRAVALLLAALAIAMFHVAIFRGVAPGMGYYERLAIWGGLFGFVIAAKPRLGRVLFPFSLAMFFLYSLIYFHGAPWLYFAQSGITRAGAAIAYTGREYMDERISVTSGMHLFLIAFLVLMATVHSWRAIDRHDRFHGFLIWWLVIMTGAASYAREKVPWVGIHIAIPLVLLAGSYAQKLVDHLRSTGKWKRWRVPLAVLLGVAIAWNAKASIHACFVHPGDVRERLAYGETMPEVKRHAEFVRDYAAIASIRSRNRSLPWDNDVFGPEWRIYYNFPTNLKDVRVLVTNEEVIWPLRWYLRDIDWTSNISVKQAVDEDWPFLFVDVTDMESNADLRAKYHLFRARARMHWTPDLVDWQALTGIWKALVPKHYRTRERIEQDIDRSKLEWVRLWDYMMYRRIPEKPDMKLSVVEYVFAVRKDLPLM